ncbi:MAG: type V CRISPR-associated endonuclease Cas1 [Bacteroidales bacterium]|nr:type V CRISPR-associated endonuclease Cas1 [Bacteroidales bacterium]
MFTNKDIKYKSIYVVNCIHERDLRVSSGELLLEDVIESKTLTKLPFQKILALFIVGHIRITTPLIDKCKKFNVTLIVVNTRFRPVFYWSNSAEANYLLRQRQFEFSQCDISIAKLLVRNKITNQIEILKKTRKTDSTTKLSIAVCRKCLNKIEYTSAYNSLMGLEGLASKCYFEALFQDLGWKKRMPRIKCDIINTTLDIGYTILFNFIECFLRMFGFDIYIGVYHRLWFKRKSLVCDIMEPFRCIIERSVRTAFHRGQFTEKDFANIKGEYRLKISKNSDYCKVFFDSLIPYKNDVFLYIQSYYRCFMQKKTIEKYPEFLI